LVTSCYTHPDRPGQKVCSECGLTLCEECSYGDGGRTFCMRCLPAADRSRNSRWSRLIEAASNAIFFWRHP